MKSKQFYLTNLENKSMQSLAHGTLTHGGALRNRRKGRCMRPLSTKEPLHLVFKINKSKLKKGLRHPKSFKLINHLFKTYGKHFLFALNN